jgi:hypothetical protein
MEDRILKLILNRKLKEEECVNLVPQHRPVCSRRGGKFLDKAIDYQLLRNRFCSIELLCVVSVKHTLSPTKSKSTRVSQ